MATAGLLALLDDIATLLDDVALLSKTAAKKTAGVLGDDLALNAQQVSGVRAERELPVVWAVARGSAKNKLILVPVALLLSFFLPWAITPLLVVGGSFLCFEGFEKIVHKLLHQKDDDEHARQRLAAFNDEQFDIVAFEREKIRGAIRTDFILSAEIVVIALGIVQGSDLLQQIVVLSLIAFAITVFVYGLVAAIVKLDDIGMAWMASTRQGVAGNLVRALGSALLSACPYLMKGLSIAGTVAMFLVGGGILVHSLPFLHAIQLWADAQPLLASIPHVLLESVINGAVGLVAGALILAVISAGQRLLSRR